MVKFSANPPSVNAAMIVGPGLDQLGFREGTAPVPRAFGIEIGEDMAVVPGRILPAPGIKYGLGTPHVDDRASWNLRDVKFARGGKLANWAVLLIQDGNQQDGFRGADDPELRRGVRGFADMCSKSGMVVERDPVAFLAVRLPEKDKSDPLRRQAVVAIEKTLKTGLKSKPSLVLVVLSNGDKNVYAGVKQLCDVTLDVTTACVQSNGFRKEKGQMQYLANVALKVNMKMGGIK